MLYKLLVKVFPNKFPATLVLHIPNSGYVDYTFRYKNKAEGSSLRVSDADLICESLRDHTLKHEYRVVDGYGYTAILSIHNFFRLSGEGNIILSSHFIDLMREMVK